MRSKKVLAVLLFFLLFVTSACGQDEELKVQLQGIVEGYVQDLANKQWDKVLPALSGDALASMEELVPTLQAVEYENKIHDLKSEVDFINDNKDRATVKATYVMEQTIPDYGTTLDEITAVFDLYKIQDQWKIYHISIADKAPQTK